MSTAADVILSAIKGAVPADVKVYDSIINGIPPARYVVLYIPGGLRSSSTVTGVSEDISLEFQITCVASDSNPAYSAVLCRWLCGTVRDAVIDLVVAADGWKPAQIKHEGSQAPQPDEATPDKKVYATDQFSLETVRI